MWCHRQLRPLAGWFLRYHYKMKGAASERRQVIRPMSHLHSIGWAHMAIADGWAARGSVPSLTGLALGYLYYDDDGLATGSRSRVGLLPLKHTN
jgi:hypothetical protein